MSLLSFGNCERDFLPDSKTKEAKPVHWSHRRKCEMQENNISSQTLVILSEVFSSSHSKAQLKSYRVQGRSFKVERPTRAKLGRCVMHICLCDLLSRDRKT